MSNHSLYQQVLNNAAVGIARVAPDGSWLEVNDKICEIVGYTKEELLQGTFQNISHPDDLVIDLDYLRETLEGKRSTYSMEKRYFHKKGHIIWINMTVSLVRDQSGEPDYLVTIVEDISKLHAARKELEESSLRFELAMQGANDGIWDWNLEANRVWFSPRWKSMLGYEEDEIGDQEDEWSDRVHPDDLESAYADIQAHLEGKSSCYENIHRVRHKDGHYLTILDRGNAIHNEQGKAVRMVGTHVDISELKKTEEELKRANLVKDEFLASMSHELRTPLTNIIGNSEYLLEEKKCGIDQCPHNDTQEIIRSIHRAGQNQLALVNDILDMSKIESGKFTVDESPYNLSLLLDELEQMFSVRAADAGIQFVIDQKNHESHLLMGDVQRISQVLINLIGNAIKFTEQGEVRLTSWVNAGSLIFQVKDSGIGMSREVMDNLFQQFHQADGTISRRFGGTGLGLYISENLADLMGGGIDVSSEEGIGSVFQLSIPYQPTETAIQSSEMGNTQPSVMDEKISGHILIAEDTPELQMLEKRILQSIGLTVAIANDGQEAVDLVNQHPFDLILMDMQMPVMDGIEATRTLREEGYTLPIIALTANVMQKHRDAFNEAGCDDFLGKPIDKNELRKVLKQYLKKKQEASHVPASAEEEVDDELMAIFMESNIQRVATLKQALAGNDWSQVREVAHAIKGSAASFGYPQLSEMAEQLQFAIDEEKMDEVPVMAIDLAIEMGKLLP